MLIRMWVIWHPVADAMQGFIQGRKPVAPVTPNYAWFSLDVTSVNSCLLLIQFTYKTTSLLRVWRIRLQVTQNLIQALHSFCYAGFFSWICKLPYSIEVHVNFSLLYNSPLGSQLPVFDVWRLTLNARSPVPIYPNFFFFFWADFHFFLIFLNEIYLITDFVIVVVTVVILRSPLPI